MTMFSPPLSPPLRARGGVGVNCKKNNNNNTKKKKKKKKNFCRRFATASSNASSSSSSSSSSSEIDGTTKSVIKKIAQKLQSGELTSLRVTEMYLKRMKDSSLNCYASVNEEDALERAAEMDRERMNPERGEKKRSLLHGIPIAVKDNICTKNTYTTAGSKILREYRPDFDADVVKHLNKEGVVVLGKTNMDEFGMGSTTESSAYAPTSNPWDESRVPGGSSGGSAAAVAAQLCAASLGSDTGGSIRQPAAFCGTVGLKPSYGRVSRHGLLAYASSFDCIGPITSSVEDAAILMDVLCGNTGDDNNSNLDAKYFDSSNNNSSSSGSSSFTDAIVSKENLVDVAAPLKGKTFAVIKETFTGLDEKVSASVMESIELVESLGAKVHEVSCPTFLFGLPAYYILALSEASSNLARYDGIRFGAQDYLNMDLVDSIKSSRFEGFGAEVKRRILMGTYTLSEGYSDAYYKRAQEVRRLIYAEMTQHLQTYDGFLTPATSSLAYMKNENQEPLAMFTGDLMTVNVNLSGLPALVIRSKDSADENNTLLPSGIQIIGKKYGEAELLGVGHIIEMFSAERKLYKDAFPEASLF
jgi:aspartyl-tRNA(Asn)/glutamyl-tRNA(Gln) amidotransferase subunit A